MGRSLNIAFAAILSLAIASCSSEGGDQASTPGPSSTSSPAPTQTPGAVPSPSATTTQAFSNPVVPPKTGTVVASATPNLIQSTNATQRAGIVSKGRVDPFATILPPPTILPNTTTNTTNRPVPTLPPLPFSPRAAVNTAVLRPRIRSAVISVRTRVPSDSLKPKINRRAIAYVPRSPKVIAVRRSYTPLMPKVLPQIVPNPNLVPVLPPAPQPEIALAVFVSGVVQVGKEPQAIIKVPNEPTSRYVQAGDRLSNGVLVKRIEMNEGSSPLVILEQYGIEVARMVGDNPTPATTASTTAPPNPVPTGAS
ncbi:MAG: hypothetical protein KME60_05465 [Cyanomargarita calcarea GSE-NOS-MK-12-04C]|uniref:Uncharacterized protein n=1 Tax=Cyanomargarita calcarea GSE-NOS-MK-12-04C TaxID=2839659 RepID=A0A951QJ68_9CYAN|nr:hypothetical protein [Cyanomargarita calcarea GSE-NOS-MK-12-04C]